ncbi:cytochrome P450, partial [Pholiota molesta]
MNNTSVEAIAQSSDFHGSGLDRGISKGNSIPNGPVGSFPAYADNWAHEFGALYSLWLGNQLFMIISDPQIAKDLMVTNGSIFSSRKEMFLKSQIIFVGRGITVTPYNNRWKTHRRLAKIWLNKTAVDGYTNVLDYEATVLVHDLYSHSQGGQLPINPQPHAGRCSLNNMLTITFALRLSREFMNCTGPVSNLVDFLPILQIQKLHADLVATYGGMINDIDERMKRGDEVPDCVVKTLLEAKDKQGLDDLDITIMCSGFMIGGVETTASIMQWFSALIPAYPEIQAKAHAELDGIVGRNRLPTIDDEKDLPKQYVSLLLHNLIVCCLQEVERTHNPFWLGTPHVSSQDFTYRGQFIPKDTVLRDHWIFGVGRRICPGMWVAEREVFLAIARMLWAFRMEEIPEEKIDLKEYDGLSGRSPVPFRIKMLPRHDNVEKVLGLA